MMEENEDEPIYEVRSNEELGRYLVAARDIKTREIIIREDPLIFGPCDRGPKEFTICLGCSRVMLSNPMNRCTTCHWPVCNEECEKLAPHASNECKIFRKNRVIYPPPHGWPVISKSIFILRCLLLKPSADWDRLMNMSDNKEFRKGRPNCINCDKKILENFEKFFPNPPNTSSGTEEQNRGFDVDEVIRISGIVDVNCHAFPLKVNGFSTYVCNLYSKTSLMAHSCTPNVSWSPDKSLSSLTLTVRSNVPIAKGELICVAYDEGQLLVCTLKRLIPNEINGMFICKCKRCKDPTEFRTYIGALKCPSCANGYLLPIDPLDSFSSWKCDNGENVKYGRYFEGFDDPFPGTISEDTAEHPKGNGAVVPECNEILDDEAIVEIIQDAERTCGYSKVDLGSVATPPLSEGDARAEGLDETLELLKEFVGDYAGSILHPNHYILQEVNVRILKAEYQKKLKSLKDVDLLQYLRRCEMLLRIANVLMPGVCEYRAFLQYHYSQGLLALERRKWRNKTIMMQKPKRLKKTLPGQSKIDPEGVPAENNVKQEEWKAVLHQALDKVDNQDENHHEDGNSEALGVDATTIVPETPTVLATTNNDESIFVIEPEKDCSCFEGTPFASTLTNYEKLLEMLQFLMTFFKELNPSHKLLRPIRDTLMETERKVKVLQMRRQSLQSATNVIPTPGSVLVDNDNLESK